MATKTPRTNTAKNTIIAWLVRRKPRIASGRSGTKCHWLSKSSIRIAVSFKRIQHGQIGGRSSGRELSVVAAALARPNPGVCQHQEQFYAFAVGGPINLYRGAI